jgi:hypothetical protein
VRQAAKPASARRIASGGASRARARSAAAIAFSRLWAPASGRSASAKSAVTPPGRALDHLLAGDEAAVGHRARAREEAAPEGAPCTADPRVVGVEHRHVVGGLALEDRAFAAA